MTSRHRLAESANDSRTFPWRLTVTILVLLAVGLLAVFEASVFEAYQQFDDRFHFLKLQTVWVILGLGGYFIASLVPYRLYQTLAQPIFALAILLLLAVLIPGIGFEANGARRWINLGFTVLQPSELTKMSIIIYLSSWLSQHQRFAPFAFILVVVLGLIMLQPDLGTAITVAGIGLTLYFVAGGSLKKIIWAGLAGAFFASILIVTSPYRLSRVKTYFNPDSDPLGSSYHIRQILIAIGSGGFFGQGIGKSIQKYQYLPESSTDSIFAIIAEETGFIGSLVVISGLAYLILQGLRIAQTAPDSFGKLLASGLTAWIGLQAILNIAAMVALVPLTGIPLPLISYGGSSLITILFSLGILVNICKSAVKAPLKSASKSRRLVTARRR